MFINPKVSVIIPVYNGSNYLREAIDSALAQTYENIEVIVVNDGSNDSGKTEEIAKSFGDKIRYFRKDNGGVATALNLGIKESQGEYVSWLSHDDLYFKNKIEIQVKYHENINDDFVITFSDFDVHNLNNNSKYTNRISYDMSTISSTLKLLFSSSIHACTILFPKSCFERVGLFSEDLKTIQDYDFLFALLKKGYMFRHIPQSLIVTRHHREQCTNTLLDYHIQELYVLYKNAVNNFIEEFRNYTNKELIEYKHVMEGRGLVKLAKIFDDLMDAFENIKKIESGTPVIWLYWENKRGRETPVIIKLCHETIWKNNHKDYIVVVTNQDNINYYLPDLSADYLLLEKIAHRADYLRFNLLYRYGGIWLDSDFVCFKSLTPLNENIRKYGFVYTGYKMEDGKTFPIIHFLGATKKNNIFKNLIDNVHSILDKKVKNGIQPEWDEIGGYPLMKLLTNNNSLLCDESHFAPVDVHGYGQRQMFLPTAECDTKCKSAFGQMLCYSVHSDFYETMGDDILRMDCYVADILNVSLKRSTIVSIRTDNALRIIYNKFKWILPQSLINYVKISVGRGR